MPVMRIYCKSGFFSNFRFKIDVLLTLSLDFFKSRTPKDFPVIIINFNRLEYLRKQIAWLESAGMKRIFIVDNNSTYPPLLEYYRTLPYMIYSLDQNKGHLAFWRTGLYRKFLNTPFVLTDPDVLPIEACPSDAVDFFYKLLNEFPEVDKVGFALKLDDLPDHYPLKEKVIAWEKRFWKEEIRQDIYRATIDTTFALYRRKNKCHGNSSGIRTSGDYIAMHLPWYEDHANLSEETLYYINTANISSSWYKLSQGEQPWWEK
jgi:hypothetical protein